MPVVFVAVALYITVPAPWHLVVNVPNVNTGISTAGLIVTALVAAVEGPLHPFAVTLMSTVPENPLAQVITPFELMAPAAELLKDQLKPVPFVAVVK
jgi:hypothetical protein